jgi:hypothetical protein
MLRAGFVGLPNVGKTTLFNAVTAQSSALIANYAFSTSKPNVGVVAVPVEVGARGQARSRDRRLR